MHNDSCLLRFEFIFGLYFIVKLSSLKQLHNYIERVLGFKDFVEFHAAFMIQSSHNLNLFY